MLVALELTMSAQKNEKHSSELQKEHSAICSHGCKRSGYRRIEEPKKEKQNNNKKG